VKTSITIFSVPIGSAFPVGVDATASYGDVTVTFGSDVPLTTDAIIGNTSNVGVVTPFGRSVPVVLSAATAGLGTVTPVTVTTSQSWETRSTGSNVVLATNFPNATHVTSHWHKGESDPNNDKLIFDPSTKVTGGGSARFTATSDQTNDWRMNMSETPGSTAGVPSGTDQQFGLKGLPRDLGDVCCIQFRWRGDTTLLDTNFGTLTEGRGGWKVMNFSKGDEVLSDSSQSGVGSNTLQEIVLNNHDLTLMPHLYTNGVSFVGIDTGMDTSGFADFTDSQGRLHKGTTFDRLIHNQHIPDPGNAQPFLRQATEAGMYDFNGDPVFGSSSGAFQLTHSTLPTEYTSRFFYYHPDEWMTFQIRVTLGDLGTAACAIDGVTRSGWTNSTVELWGAREGQASVKLTERTGVVIARGDGAANTRDDQVPYRACVGSHARWLLLD
jgi:hypothetical protein